jgi:hypothetical protein
LKARQEGFVPKSNAVLVIDSLMGAVNDTAVLSEGQQKKVEFIVARVLLADDVLGILNLATYINSCR